MKNIKTLTFALLISIAGAACSSGTNEHHSEQAHEAEDAPKTVGTGHRDDHDTGKVEAEGFHNEDLPTGTGTETKMPDTVAKKGKWPTQGDPFK